MTRPRDIALGYQTWRDLAFFHWAVDPAALRPLVPSSLQIDTFDGEAFVTVVPMTVVEARPRGLRGLSEYHELNVRTYVREHGRPGVWFFSLDVNRWAPAALGRAGRLPFRVARIERSETDDRHWFRCVRGTTELAMSWHVGDPVGPARPGSLEEFLSERYLTYSRAAGRALLRWRLRHPSFQLRRVEELAIEGGLLQADRLPVDVHRRPLAYHCEDVASEMLPVQLAA